MKKAEKENPGEKGRNEDLFHKFLTGIAGGYGLQPREKKAIREYILHEKDIMGYSQTRASGIRLGEKEN